MHTATGANLGRNAPVDASAVGDLAALIPSYLRSLRAANKSAKTIATYGEAVRQLLDFLRETGRRTELAKLTRDDVESFVEHLVATRSAATASNRYRALCSFFAWAVDWGEIAESPMRKMTPPKVPEKPVPVLSEDQLRALLRAAEGRGEPERRDTAILRLFLDTGMRLSELANLRVAELDLDARVAVVLGKGRRPRSCPFGAKTASAVDRYVSVRARNPYAATSDSLWLGVRGPLGTAGVRSVVERRSKQAGLEGVHAHLFRHYFASAWLRDGGQETDLMRLAGWRSRDMLSRYGAAVADERARAAYQTRSPGDRL